MDAIEQSSAFPWKDIEVRMEALDKMAVTNGWDDKLRKDRLLLLVEAWSGSRKEEQVWRQKSRIKWLKEGDRNSKFFHFVANGRRRRNFIGDLCFNGVSTSNPHLIREGIFDFFKKQYSKVEWQRPKINGLNLKRLSTDQRNGLEVVFTYEEVWDALCSCNGNISPGPDGFNLNFIKTHWGLIKEDFMNFVNGFHEDSSVIKDLNDTFITLIPKTKRPNSVGDFRPISLVGSMYKIVSKMLANRLKKVMNTVIGEFQMAFVKGRQITDSFVIAEEIINKWKREKVGGLVVKLVFEKAYDSVDHGFLDSMLENMGFGFKWRRWIADCISSPRLSVLINGCPTKQFGMERGLRQGDPLSPFLFNIVSEGLSCLLQKAVGLEMIKGEDFDRNGIHISHLQFADDTIMFIKPKIEYVLNIKRILRCFELASGLKVNFHKSCVARVGSKVPENPVWATALNCRDASLPFSYLGFPLGSRPCSKAFWRTLVEKIEARLAP